ARRCRRSIRNVPCSSASPAVVAHTGSLYARVQGLVVRRVWCVALRVGQDPVRCQRHQQHCRARAAAPEGRVEHRVDLVSLITPTPAPRLPITLMPARLDVGRLLVISSATHYAKNGTLAAYGPYSREIDIWADLVEEVVIAAPCVQADPPAD